MKLKEKYEDWVICFECGGSGHDDIYFVQCPACDGWGGWWAAIEPTPDETQVTDQEGGG